MISLLTGFVAELRRVGIPVSMVEAIDAAQALEHVPLGDREALRHGLSSCLVKNEHHLAAFQSVFDVYFSLLPPVEPAADPEAVGGDGAGDTPGAAGGKREEPGRCRLTATTSW